MEIPHYQPFYLQSVADLRSEVTRLGIEIPIDNDLSPLSHSAVVAGKTAPNRWCAQPIASGDANSDGSPGPLARKRYRDYSAGGFGLIWMECTSALEPEHPGQLFLSRENLPRFNALVEEVRAKAKQPPVVLIQLSAANPEALIEAAKLAENAGFDGIDIQINRSLLPDTLARVRSTAPKLLLATRLCAYEAFRGGFGVCTSDYRKCDLTVPFEYGKCLVENGLQLLNITSASPCLLGPDRGKRAIADSENPEEHPLMSIARQLSLVKAFREGFPTLSTTGSGLSWLRQFVPQVAAGALKSHWLDFVGLGRAALAYPNLPEAALDPGSIQAGATCMMCSACSQLHDAGRKVGCVVRDPDFYGPVFRDMRRLSQDQLMAGAARCHLCEAAPCREKSPANVDIPSVIKAFREGNEQRSYQLIRSQNPLPELVSITSPSWLEEEGACIESTLSGRPVPIQDLQYTVAWRARENGLTGVKIPEECSRKTIAIVGAGPTGIAAASRLLERGHQVHILETSKVLGGVPIRLLAKARAFANPGEEIDALLKPAIETRRLQIFYRKTLGRNVFLRDLISQYEAVLISVGLWQERSLGKPDGVISALDLIENGLSAVPRRVAVLAGGDSAMDACTTLYASGAAEIYVIFGGARSEMHWHMPDGWLAKPGVHAMMHWQPLGYELSPQGKATGVRMRHRALGVEATQHVDLVVEAMGLGAEQSVVSELAIHSTSKLYTAGSLLNGGASVGHCIAEGLSVAEAIHSDLLK